MNKNVIILVVFFSFCNFVNGQENTWSLQKCMGKALENNIEIKIRQLEIKRTQKSQNSVLNRMLPTVTLYGEQGYNFGSSIDPSTNGRVSSNLQNDNFYINAKMNLIDFGAFVNAQKDKISIEQAKAEREVIENEYKLQILESFYQALFTQELLKIQKEQFKNAIFNLERITKQVEIGSKPKSDWYDMQLIFSEEETQILETEQLYTTQKMKLFQLMNVENRTINEIVLESNSNKSESETVESNLSNPKIKRAELLYQNSLKSIRLERANNLPSLSGYYSLSTFYYKKLNQSDANTIPFRNQLSDNKSQQVGIQLNVPVFNGFRNNKKIISSKIESEKTKLALEQEKQQLNNQIALEEQNKNNYVQIQSKLIEKQSFAKASLTTNQAKFTSGKIEAIVYSSVKNQVLTAEYEVLKNKLQLDYIDLKIHLLRN